MPSIKRTARAAHEKYSPGEEQRAEHERIRENLEHLARAELKNFDQALAKMFKPLGAVFSKG